MTTRRARLGKFNPPGLAARGVSTPSFWYEEQAGAQRGRRVAGIDEAGRGPLAGPVVAAAVILPYPCDLPGVNDSKLLTPDQRERLYSQIAGLAPGIAFSVIPADTIDRINILEAAKMAMTQAVQAIDPPPDHLLIDGPISLRVDIPQQSVIKGDRMSVSIAAASVVAKVTRDRLMLELHSEFPQYGFDKHKGYPTKDHRAALLRYGPCPAHRKSFKGVKELL